MSCVEEIVREIKAAKKYKVLSEDTIRDVVNLEVKKHNSLKNAKKSARKKLHLILASYLYELDYSVAGQELRAAFSTGDRERIRTACLNIMERHASTRERLQILDEFYNKIFEITGKPRRLADLACALNPFSFRWMGLAADVDYCAFDNNVSNIELLELYFELEGLKPLTEQRDILCNPPENFFEVAFLFKMYHCLEHRRKGAGWKVIEKTPARWLVVSFPTRNLRNRRADIFANYKDSLLANTGRNNWPSQILEFDPEIVLLINKGDLETGRVNP